MSHPIKKGNVGTQGTRGKGFYKADIPNSLKGKEKRCKCGHHNTYHENGFNECWDCDCKGFVKK